MFYSLLFSRWSFYSKNLFSTNDFKKGDPAEIFWKYFQNKWFSWSYKTTNLTEKWRNCWVFWRKSRYFDWFKYGFSITPTEFITYFQNILAGSPFLKSLLEFKYNNLLELIFKCQISGKFDFINSWQTIDCS